MCTLRRVRAMAFAVTAADVPGVDSVEWRRMLGQKRRWRTQRKAQMWCGHE
jgi:hypothetical protein